MLRDLLLLHPNARGLHLAVRPLVVGRFLGQLMVPLAALSLVPATVSLADGHLEIAARYVAVALVLGGAGWWLATRRCRDDIQTNEALVITASIFVLSSLLMTVPLMGYGLGFLDAWFEAVSGVTTTGLSVSATVSDKPIALLFSRAWLQWVGGLGVVVLALALVIRPGVASRQLGFEEREMESLAGGTRAHAKRVLAVYAVLTAVGTVALLLTGVSLVDALCYTMSAVSTGGFANHDNSLAALPVVARGVVIAACVAGALSFSWFYGGFYRSFGAYLRDPTLRAMLVACAGAVCAMMLVTSPRGADWLAHLGHMTLMVLSAQTTAGFSSVPVSELEPAGKLVLSASMFVGGEIGSTAGGVKIFRVLIVLRLLHLLLLRASTAPAAHLPMRLGRQRVRAPEIEAAVAIIASYTLVVLASWLVFVAHGYPAEDALFEVVSAIGTAGLSSGLTGAGLEPVLKFVLIMNMLMGRVETVAMLILLLPGTWLGPRRRVR